LNKFLSLSIFVLLQISGGVCLLVCFLLTEFDKIQKEKPLELPPKPPQKRKWRGSTVAPFAGNNMLVLYSCPAPDKARSKHFVQVLHNEHPIPMPVSFSSSCEVYAVTVIFRWF
jgi:hypothetical protein